MVAAAQGPLTSSRGRNTSRDRSSVQLIFANDSSICEYAGELDVCVALAKGGGCLFTFNCSTTPGGYLLPHCGCQVASHSYDAPIYSLKLKSGRRGKDLSVTHRPEAALAGTTTCRSSPVGTNRPPRQKRQCKLPTIWLPSAATPN